jgi:hypothetical protein
MQSEALYGMMGRSMSLERAYNISLCFEMFKQSTEYDNGFWMSVVSSFSVFLITQLNFNFLM